MMYWNGHMTTAGWIIASGELAVEQYKALREAIDGATPGSGAQPTPSETTSAPG